MARMSLKVVNAFLKVKKAGAVFNLNLLSLKKFFGTLKIRQFNLYKNVFKVNLF